MKFAAPYQLDSICPIDHSKIDEFNISFNETSSFKELGEFAKKYSSHQINVSFKKDYDIDSVVELCNQFSNIYIRLHPWEFKYLSSYEEKKVNYIFDSTIPIYNYSLLEWILNHNVKGIYIADDLTYNLEEVFNQCSEKNIKLRVVLNKVPMTNFLSLSCPSVQVYQPQNYNFLSKYYDVGEFSYDGSYDWGKAKIMYQKWFIDHDWNSDLKYMNQDLILPYPTKSIPVELTKMRSACQHRCTMRSTNICSKCRRFLLMGYENDTNNITYQDIEYNLPSLEEMVNTILISKEDNIK